MTNLSCNGEVLGNLPFNSLSPRNLLQRIFRRWSSLSEDDGGVCFWCLAMGVEANSSGIGEDGASFGVCCLSPMAPRDSINVVEIAFNVPDGGASSWLLTALSTMNLNYGLSAVASFTSWFLSIRSWLKSVATFEASLIKCICGVSYWSLIPLLWTNFNCIGETVANFPMHYTSSSTQPSSVPDFKISPISKYYGGKPFLPLIILVIANLNIIGDTEASITLCSPPRRRQLNSITSLETSSAKFVRGSSSRPVTLLIIKSFKSGHEPAEILALWYLSSKSHLKSMTSHVSILREYDGEVSFWALLMWVMTSPNRGSETVTSFTLYVQSMLSWIESITNFGIVLKDRDGGVSCWLWISQDQRNLSCVGEACTTLV